MKIPYVVLVNTFCDFLNTVAVLGVALLMLVGAAIILAGLAFYVMLLFTYPLIMIPATFVFIFLYHFLINLSLTK